MPSQHAVTIDPSTIQQVQASWRLIGPLASRLSKVFYDNLFRADPTLVPLFKSNQRGEMAEQGQKLMQMLGYAVDGFDDLETLTPMLRDLGWRHAGYGVEEAHYETVGEALIQTLAEGLGDSFTPAVCRAWREAYEVMASTMIAGSRTGSPTRRS